MATRTKELDEQAQGALDEVRKTMDDPAEAKLPEEVKFNFRTSGFSRMRTEWRGGEQEVIHSALNAVEDRMVLRLFPDAYQVMMEVYTIVRTQVADDNGEGLVDDYGLPVWKRLPSGAYEEDYTRLSQGQMKDLLFRITTNLFAWEQMAADLWGEAMFAKVQFEEHHSFAYISEYTGKDTVEGRSAYASQQAIDERYFAVFQSLLSRKADALVRSMERLSQRLKDALTM